MGGGGGLPLFLSFREERIEGSFVVKRLRYGTSC